MTSPVPLATAALLGAALVVPGPASEPGPEPTRFDPAVVDRSLDPCTDFFAYTCSRWIAANPIPPDQARWGTGSSLALWNDTVLHRVLEEAASGRSERTAAEALAGTYWLACADEGRVERQGLEPIAADLARIDGLTDKKSLAAEVARLHLSAPRAFEMGDTQTAAALLGFGPIQDFADSSLVVAGIDQGGLGLPSRDFYLSADPEMERIRERYRRHLKKMLALSGRTTARAETEAASVLRIEAKLARSAMDPVSRRDPRNIYHPMSPSQLRRLVPSFGWGRYLGVLGAPASRHYVVTAPDFFRDLERLLRSEPLGAWKAYLRWWALHGSAPYLGRDFAEETFDFYGRTLTGAAEQRPRWRRCAAWADRDIGDALGQAYVGRVFPPERKRRVEAIVRDVEDALGRAIAQLDWMGEATRKQAAGKLAAIENKIGYPARWRDYSSLKLDRDRLAVNVRQAAALEMRRQIAKIGKPVDRTEWQMTAPTADAYYDVQLNTVNFPAGILQPPFFDAAQDDAVNYAAIGMIVGHEIIHGFDDQGRKFDAVGNLRDWWTAEDARSYEQRAQCLADQYSREIPELGVRQDGRLTLGEDTSDNGGLRLALLALEADLARKGASLDAAGPDGLTTRQRFFIAYAFAWCRSWRPEAERTHVGTDPHSLPRFRVNNVVANMPDFHKAFACPAGKSMVHEPACRVW